MARQHLKQRSDGRYACRAEGHWFYGDTEKEALAKRAEYYRMREKGMKEEAYGMTVKRYALKWLPANKVSVTDHTYNSYACMLNALCERIGHLRISDVVPSDIKEFFSEEYKDYSDSHIRHAKNLFTSMFDGAVDDGLCVRNPCRAKTAQPHKGTAGTHRALTDEEIQLINNTPHRMRTIAMIMLYAGLRRGEALGINIERDVDFDKSTISVNGAIHFEKNRPIYQGRGKTAAALRTIPLFLPLHKCLSSCSGDIGIGARGNPITETAFRFGWKSYLDCLSDAAGHRIEIRPHDLRHTFCTFLRFSEVDLKTAMLWMGHSSESMILRIYDHISDERIQKESEKVKKRLFGSQNGSQNAANVSKSLDL